MLVIEEEHLLNALLRALCTVKFACPPECAKEVAGSPFVAEVAHRVYDALIAIERREYREGDAHRSEQARSADQMEQGRSAGQPSLLRLAVQAHIRRSGAVWASWTDLQKQEFVRILLAPYIATPEFIASLVAEADSSPPGAT